MPSPRPRHLAILPPALSRWARPALAAAVAVPVGAPAAAQPEGDWLNVPNALAPKGPFAATIADVWWYLFVVATAVFVIVGALFLVAAFRRGRSADTVETARTEDERTYPWLIVGTVITAIILLATAIVTFLTMRTLASPATPAVHTFEVVGHQWWWEIRYEGEPIGANEIRVPVGEPVRLLLDSADVIHSLWVPELMAKLDLVPGHPNEVWLQADEAGTYRGLCAEFCGMQHAKMALLVIAEEPARFEAWLERMREDASRPQGEAARAGQSIFQNVGCAGCHTIRGTGARGALGPDLTHLASRRTLAAAQLPNTRGHLGGWIVDPQEIKPGNHMPPQDVSGEELQALLDYLATLR